MNRSLNLFKFKNFWVTLHIEHWQTESYSVGEHERRLGVVCKRRFHAKHQIVIMHSSKDDGYFAPGVKKYLINLENDHSYDSEAALWRAGLEHCSFMRNKELAKIRPRRIWCLENTNRKQTLQQKYPQLVRKLQ